MAAFSSWLSVYDVLTNSIKDQRILLAAANGAAKEEIKASLNRVRRLIDVREGEMIRQVDAAETEARCHTIEMIEEKTRQTHGALQSRTTEVTAALASGDLANIAATARQLQAQVAALNFEVHPEVPVQGVEQVITGLQLTSPSGHPFKGFSSSCASRPSAASPSPVGSPSPSMPQGPGAGLYSPMQTSPLATAQPQEEWGSAMTEARALLAEAAALADGRSGREGPLLRTAERAARAVQREQALGVHMELGYSEGPWHPPFQPELSPSGAHLDLTSPSIYNFLDTNNDGVVGRHELRAAVAAGLLCIPESTIRERSPRWDDTSEDAQSALQLRMRMSKLNADLQSSLAEDAAGHHNAHNLGLPLYP